MVSCCIPGRSSMALFTRTAKLDPGVHGARCAWAMAVHHAVGISRQKNSGYRPSKVSIVAQGLSTPDLSLISPTHLSIRRGRATTTHYTHHQVSLMVSRNTTLVPSLWLRIWPACEAGLSACMPRECVSPQNKKEEEGIHTRWLRFNVLFGFGLDCMLVILKWHIRTKVSRILLQEIWQP